MKKEVTIQADGAELQGDLVVPTNAAGIVLFAHGSGSSRLSPRNVFVADELNKAGIATLLFDLLTEKEDEAPDARFDIDLLAERLINVTQWVKFNTQAKGLAIGYFGASTGAAAALQAAAELGNGIKAVVSRGGRPDLASESLATVSAPSLLIVGGADEEVLKLNRQAAERMACRKEIKIVPEASHLFEEPGALEQVAELAADWFSEYLK